MSIQAAQRMGIRCLSLDPGIDTPASQIAASVVGALDDPAKIAEIFGRCERVTLENEFIPAGALLEGMRRAGRSEDALVPGVETLAAIQDKLRQREALAAAGVPSPRALALDDGGDRAVAEIGFPMVLKARFGGYDGKGTRYARSLAELDEHRPLWESGGWLAEEFVPFRRELAVMVVSGGHTNFELETVETIQTNHVCDVTFPSRFGVFGAADTDGIASAAVRAVGGFGLFGVELFETAAGDILVNEIAPRPHNTGHYTLDWGGPSQFDYHVRLALGLTLSPPVLTQPTYMANLLGQAGADSLLPAIHTLLSHDPEIRFHWYGKVEAKPGRKMGHLNLVSSLPDSNRVRQARTAFYEAWTRQAA